MQDTRSQTAVAPSLRVRTFLKGIVYYDNRRVSLECTVRDLSDTGARIALHGEAAVPDNVELSIPQKDRVYKALVRRRDAFELGLSFELPRSPEPRRAEDMGLVDRVAILEQELAAMRKLVRRLRDKVLPNDAD